MEIDKIEAFELKPGKKYLIRLSEKDFQAMNDHAKLMKKMLSEYNIKGMAIITSEPIQIVEADDEAA